MFWLACVRIFLINVRKGYNQSITYDSFVIWSGILDEISSLKIAQTMDTNTVHLNFQFTIFKSTFQAS